MRRIYVALGLIALIAGLHYEFPYVLQDENARMRVLYFVTLLSVIFVFGPGARKFSNMPRAWRDAAIWLAILVLLVSAYSFRDEFEHSRLVAELIPSRAQVNGDGTVSIRVSENGHFYIEGKVGETVMRFLIDTGASDVVLAPDDAKRIGLQPDSLEYTRFFSTANGGGTGASVTLPELVIGNIVIRRMPVTVNKTWMPESLLGMSFLRRLHGFRVEGDRLLLMP